MRTGEFAVVVLDDQINTFHAVAYLPHRVAGLPADEAVRHTRRIHVGGDVEVSRSSDRDEAECLTAWLQLYGLNAMVRHD